MLETLKDIALALILAGTCAIGAYVMKSYKQKILETVTDLVQKAEDAIQGSGMGTEKKAKVVAQLEAMGIKVTSWVNAAIDSVVAYLNEKSGWFADSATDTAKEAVQTVTEEIAAATAEEETSGES